MKLKLVIYRTCNIILCTTESLLDITARKLETVLQIFINIINEHNETLFVLFIHLFCIINILKALKYLTIKKICFFIESL